MVQSRNKTCINIIQYICMMNEGSQPDINVDPVIEKNEKQIPFRHMNYLDAHEIFAVTY